MVEPSAYYVVREPDLPLDGEGRLRRGYVVVHSWSPGAPQSRRFVVHAAPGADPIGAAETALERAQIASGGRFDGAAVRANFPASVADRVLWATWDAEETDPETGERVTVRRRGPVADVPPGATVVASDQVPHVWLGQEVV